MDAALRDMLREKIRVRRFLERDEYGQPGYGPDTIYKGRVSFENELVRGSDGAEKTSSAQVIMTPNAIVGPKDQVILPLVPWSADQPVMSVVRVAMLKDENGVPHHLKVWLA